MSPAHPTEPGTQLPGGGLLFGIPGTVSILLPLIRSSSLPVMPAFTLSCNSGTSKHGSWLGVVNWLLIWSMPLASHASERGRGVGGGWGVNCPRQDPHPQPALWEGLLEGFLCLHSPGFLCS